MDLTPNYSGVGYGKGGLVVPDPSKTNVMFFTKAKHFPAESETAGYPVYHDVLYVRVQHPGERDSVVVEANASHKAKWPAAFKAFEEGRKLVPEGTPLSLLFPGGNEPAILTMNALGLFTIEQVAEMADSATGNIPFGGDLKQRAIRYLEATKKGADFNKMQSELDEEKKARKSLEMQLDDLQGKFSQLAAEREGGPGVSSSPSVLTPEMLQQITAALAATQTPKRGPGRPPKDQA